MSYATGTANSLADLITAIRTACVSSGWTVSGNVLVKAGIAIRIQPVTRGSVTGLEFCGGRGESAGALVGACPHVAEMASWPAASLTYPLAYHLFHFTDPDEVYLVVNSNVDLYQWAAWGKSSVQLPGSGMWFASTYYDGSVSGTTSFSETVSIDAVSSPVTWFYSCPGLFFRSQMQSIGAAEAYVDHGLDSNTWSTGSSAAPGPTALPAVNPLLSILPNLWNSEAVLLPIVATIYRPASLASVVVMPKNARYTRIDNYEPRQIVTLGADRWMVLPFVRKNTGQRNGMSGSTGIHSGTLGWAIRYDGA